MKGGPEIIDIAELGEDAKTARNICLGSWYILDISVDEKSDTVCGIRFVQTFV